MSDFNIQFEEQDQSITLEFEQIGGGAVKSVNGMTGDVMLDADDVGAYTKPAGGIPKTDLASAVQTSLGKADSAYQKPSSGIPASDMANGVIPTVDNTLTVIGAAADAKKTGDELSSLKEEFSAISSIGSDFNLLTYDKASNSYAHLGLDIHNFHIKGTITQGDKNICVTGDGITEPTEISFSTLNEKYFSVPLVANKKYTFALLGSWESNGMPPNGVHVADKGTRTAKTITIPNTSWGNGIATISFTPTKTDVYAVKVYFPAVGTVDLQLALYPPNNVYQQISNITALTLSN